jgi:LuxR family quorum sensing-dependent transcriptional regulator/LuxR family quorum-sensing system transcriptional regulator CciR
MNFERVSAFASKLPGIETSAEVGAAFAELVAPYGYFAVSCGGSSETPAGRTWDFFFNTWPGAWLSIYRDRDYVRHDLAPIMARLTSRPFTLPEITRGREMTPKQLEFQDWIREIGIVDGFGVPIHEPGGEIGLCVSLADHRIEDIEERQSLEIASLHAYRRCRDLGGHAATSSVASALSTREVECLRWVLKGKSDREIGAILDISHTTAHFHIERVKKKLGVSTRLQAVGLLVTLGYI